MDNVLQSLTNTLEAINGRQAAMRKRARKGGDATPFATAVLNRERLDIYTYIRDSDASEAGLFWYPPLPQSAAASRAGPSASAQTRSSHPASARTASGVHLNDDASDADLLLAPRLPEPRQVELPTPLRNSSSASGHPSFQNQQSDDPNRLLCAALSLNDTYGKGSRTRKHIKGLLKTHAGLNEAIKNYELQIRQSEAQLRASTEGKSAAAHPGATFDGSQPDTAPSPADEAQLLLLEVQESIRKEELEILALDEMIGELRQARSDRQKQELQKQEEAALASDTTVTHPQERQPLRVLPRDSLVQADEVDTSEQGSALVNNYAPEEVIEPELQDSAQDLAHQVADTHPTPAEEEQSSSVPPPQHSVDETIEVDSSFQSANHEASFSQSSEPAADLTIQPGQDEQVEDATDLTDNSAVILPADVPIEMVAARPQESRPSHLLAPAQQGSRELERVTLKVWDVFGDALRFVAPERESSNYLDTLELLKSLMSGGDKNAGDYSVGSVQTASTTSSEVSGAAAAQLTPEVLMTAFVIFQMLVSDEPHRMNIDDLKVRGHEWWSSSGMQVWLQARSHDENDVPSHVEAFEDGQNLARKATYGMISKQLFAIKRQKGVGLVGFAES